MQEASRIARKLSALEEMGLERVDASPVTTEAVRIDRATWRVTSSRAAMGTLVSVTALGPSERQAEDAIGRALEEMDRLIAIFTRFESGSALSTLNANGRLDGAPPELSHVVSHAGRFHGMTAGAFDVSVEPLVALFRERLDGTARSEPTPAEIADARALAGAGDIVVSERQIRFERSGMAVTLDGVAKGHIVDGIAQVLVAHGLERYLINAGGDIRTAGTKEHRRPWTVAVQDPTKSGDFPDTIHLTDCAIATSGSYEVFFDRDRQFHHIVSARNGRSPTHSTSVSVIAPTAMTADALATGVFVMEPREGIQFTDMLPDCECLIIDEDGRQWRSRGWRSATPNH